PFPAHGQFFSVGRIKTKEVGVEAGHTQTLCQGRPCRNPRATLLSLKSPRLRFLISQHLSLFGKAKHLGFWKICGYFTLHELFDMQHLPSPRRRWKTSLLARAAPHLAPQAEAHPTGIVFAQLQRESRDLGEPAGLIQA